MIDSLKKGISPFVLFVVQTALLPLWLDNPYRPVLLLTPVVVLGLRGRGVLAGAGVFTLGLLQDAYGGISFGISGFAYLALFLLLQKIADRLYTDNDLLVVIIVFVSALVIPLIQLLFLIVFSAANDLYVTLLPALLPNAVVSSVASWFILRVQRLFRPAEAV